MKDKAWPIGIAVVLAVVMIVNLAVAWFAVNHPPEIVESYADETR